MVITKITKGNPRTIDKQASNHTLEYEEYEEWLKPYKLRQAEKRKAARKFEKSFIGKRNT